MDTSPNVLSSSSTAKPRVLSIHPENNHDTPPPLPMAPGSASASAPHATTINNATAAAPSLASAPSGLIPDVPEEPAWIISQGIRTSSIDSGISSPSSAQSLASPTSSSSSSYHHNRRQHHHHNGSSSSSNAGSASATKVAAEEITHAIKSAGSAEAAISKLILDKRSLIMENGNLRQLIEKQRPVLKGLNHDFECKVRENEKYKQKLAEMEGVLKNEDAGLPHLGEAVRATFTQAADSSALRSVPSTSPSKDSIASASHIHKSASLRDTPRTRNTDSPNLAPPISPGDTIFPPPRRALTEPAGNPTLPSIEDSASEFEDENVDDDDDGEGDRTVMESVNDSKEVVVTLDEAEDLNKDRRQHSFSQRSPPPSLPLPPLPHHQRPHERVSMQPLSEKEKESLYYKQLPLPPIPLEPPPLPASRDQPSRPTTADDRGRPEVRDASHTHAHRQSLSARPSEGKKPREKSSTHFDSSSGKGSSSNSKRSKRLTISTDLVPRLVSNVSNSPTISQPTLLASSQTFPAPPSSPFSSATATAAPATGTGTGTGTVSGQGKYLQTGNVNGAASISQKTKTSNKLGLQALIDNNSRNESKGSSATTGTPPTRHNSHNNNNTAPSSSSNLPASSSSSSTAAPSSSKQRHFLTRRGSPRMPEVTFRDPFAQHSANETSTSRPSTAARPANTNDLHLSGWMGRTESPRTPADDPSSFIRRPSLTDSTVPVPPTHGQIYRGLVSDDLPDILVPPSSLHAIEIRVVSSRLRPKRESCIVPAINAGGTSTNTFNKHGDTDENVFTLGVFPRKPSTVNNTNDNSNNITFPPSAFARGELWRVEKPLSSLPTFDAMLRPVVTDVPARLPERSLFNGHSPSKIDARRNALNTYFSIALEASRTAAVAGGNVAAGMVVCQFLSTNVIEPRDDETAMNKRMLELEYPLNHNSSNKSLERVGSELVDDGSSLGTGGEIGRTGSSDMDNNINSNKPYMEGYLTKKGKNFGGWKARYFILNSQKLRYYETPRGNCLGSIKLQRAKITSQSTNGGSTGNGISNSGSTDNNNSGSGLKDDMSTNTPISENDSQYRHAFVIREHKKNVKHTFCAESDEERDAWVTALLYYVDEDVEDDGLAAAAAAAPSPETTDETHHTLSLRRERRSMSMPPSSRKTIMGKGKDKSSTDDSSVPPNEPMVSIRYDDLPVREAPTRSATNDYRSNSPNQPQNQVGDKDKKRPSDSPSQPQRTDSLHYLNISSPTNGSVIQNAGAWGMKSSSRASTHGSTRIGLSARERKRSIFSSLRTSTAVIGTGNGESTREVGKRAASDAAALARARTDEPDVPQMPNGNHNAGGNGGGTTGSANDPHRYAVFGIPLADAVAISPPRDAATNQIIDCGLPAVVYRLLTYLRAKEAELEEGIFRVSGSSATVKKLRERFAAEGDVDLLAEGELYVDVHAVASLFKQYLRELPSSVLTRELHNDFAKALDIKDTTSRLATFRQLILRLPVPNRALLRSVTEILYIVVTNQDINLMNLRNVGIVFTPTLNIPTSVFCALLQNFNLLFEPPDNTPAPPTNLPLPSRPATGGDYDDAGTSSDVYSDAGDSVSDIQSNSALPNIAGNAASSSNSSLQSAPPMYPSSTSTTAPSFSRKRTPRFSHYIDTRASNSVSINSHPHSSAYLAAPGFEANANIPGKLNAPTSPMSLPPPSPSPSHAHSSFSPLPSPSGGSATRRKR